MNKFLVPGFSIFLFFSAFLSFLKAEEVIPDSPEAALSEEPSSRLSLPEVVTTANRLDTPVSQVANSMTVITAEDIEKKQTATAMGALRGVPGLTLLQNGSAGSNSGLFIRGADAGHALVLLNGIPLNNPISTSRGFEALDQIFVDDIHQIEVVRGPLSTVYGTNATAGVVNIISQKGGGTPRGSFLFEGGAYQSFREAVSASGGNDFGNFSFSLSRFDTQGFPSADRSFGNTVNSASGNTTASLRLGVQPFSNLSTHYFTRFTQSRTNVAANGGANGDDPGFFVEERIWATGLQTKWSLLEGGWEHLFGISLTNDLQKFTDDFSSYVNSHYERGVYEGQAAQFHWQQNLNWKDLTLMSGLQVQREWGRVDDTTDYGYGLSTTWLDKTNETLSGFAEVQAKVMERMYITLGGRQDAYGSFGNQSSWRAAGAYFVPGIETKLKATYGTGFKAPSLYQLYSPYGDPNLRIETSQGWDAGVEQVFEKSGIGWGATYFHNDFTHLIDFDPNTFVYNNINQARTEGWETFASAKPVKDLEFRFSYTYTWALNTQTGDPLIRRPQNKADLSGSYQWAAANLGFNVAYVGERPDLSFVNFSSVPVTLPSYTLVNLMASYQLDERLKLFGRVNNLFNTIYEEVYGYGTPGFSVYMGTKISL